MEDVRQYKFFHFNFIMIIIKSNQAFSIVILSINVFIDKLT